ncbi:lipopolysaccharide biosynthesis protein [Candidatus Saccharibacteria bacterium]|nr:lipopolysaccharide biosynthesis protein [Candidatus Saccharibacteria bacterium]
MRNDKKVVNKPSSSLIFSGVFWKFGERILAQSVSLVVSIVLARFLLPEQYGVIAIVLIFIAFADVLTVSGYSASLIQKKDATKVDFDSIFYCSLATSILVYLILFFCAPLIASFYSMPLLIPVIRVFSLRIIISSYNSVQHAFVSRHMLFKKFFFSTLFGTLVSGVVGIYLATKGAGVWALVAQYLTNTVIDSIVLSFTIKWHPGRNFSWLSVKGLMKFGWKVLAADFSGTFFDQLRSLLIGRAYTSADLALYNKGQQLPSLVIDNANNSIMAVLFPAIANSNDNMDRVKQLTRQLVRTISYVTIPIAALLCLVARPLIIVLLTEKWSDATIYMQLLCMAAAISLTGNISLQTVKAVGRSDILLKLEFVKKPVYVLLLVIGMNISVVAVAVTSLLYAIYSTVVNSKAMSKITGYTLSLQMRDMLKGYVVGALCCILPLAVLLLDMPPLFLVLAQGVLFIASYAVLVKVMKITEIKNMAMMIFRKVRRKNG